MPSTLIAADLSGSTFDIVNYRHTLDTIVKRYKNPDIIVWGGSASVKDDKKSFHFYNPPECIQRDTCPQYIFNHVKHPYDNFVLITDGEINRKVMDETYKAITATEQHLNAPFAKQLKCVIISNSSDIDLSVLNPFMVNKPTEVKHISQTGTKKIAATNPRLLNDINLFKAKLASVSKDKLLDFLTSLYIQLSAEVLYGAIDLHNKLVELSKLIYIKVKGDIDVNLTPDMSRIIEMDNALKQQDVTYINAVSSLVSKIVNLNKSNALWKLKDIESCEPVVEEDFDGLIGECPVLMDDANLYILVKKNVVTDMSILRKTRTNPLGYDLTNLVGDIVSDEMYKHMQPNDLSPYMRIEVDYAIPLVALHKMAPYIYHAFTNGVKCGWEALWLLAIYKASKYNDKLLPLINQTISRITLNCNDVQFMQYTAPLPECAFYITHLPILYQSREMYHNDIPLFKKLTENYVCDFTMFERLHVHRFLSKYPQYIQNHIKCDGTYHYLDGPSQLQLPDHISPLLFKEYVDKNPVKIVWPHYYDDNTDERDIIICENTCRPYYIVRDNTSWRQVYEKQFSITKQSQIFSCKKYFGEYVCKHNKYPTVLELFQYVTKSHKVLPRYTMQYCENTIRHFNDISHKLAPSEFIKRFNASVSIDKRIQLEK